MDHQHGERAKVLDLWRTLEMFSPQLVKKVDPTAQVFAVQPGSLLPWEKDEPLPDDEMWRHRVLLGVYDLEDLF